MQNLPLSLDASPGIRIRIRIITSLDICLSVSLTVSSDIRISVSLSVSPGILLKWPPDSAPFPPSLRLSRKTGRSAEAPHLPSSSTDAIRRQPAFLPPDFRQQIHAQICQRRTGKNPPLRVNVLFPNVQGCDLCRCRHFHVGSIHPVINDLSAAVDIPADRYVDMNHPVSPVFQTLRHQIKWRRQNLRIADAGDDFRIRPGTASSGTPATVPFLSTPRNKSPPNRFRSEQTVSYVSFSILHHSA